jgi:hypothetical protein
MKIIVNFFTLFLVLLTVMSCDKVSVTKEEVPLLLHRKDFKPRTPVKLGEIRAYFGDEYLTFDQHIEKVAPVDSFSNCFFYGTCSHMPIRQINMIRCDSTFVLAIYINGYSLDSLNSTFDVPVEYGRYTSIEFYPFNSWNYTDKGHYSLSGLYGMSLRVTDNTDDILTGTFEGSMYSNGLELPVKEGEFKIKILRKDMSCPQGK